MKFGFIGAGNMVSAIVHGMTSSEVFNEMSLYCVSKHGESAKALAEATNTHYVEDSKTLIETCDVIVLGVKPHIVEEVLTPLFELIETHRPLIISLAAGKTLSNLEALLPQQTKLVRVMPNINAKVNASTTGICQNEFVSEIESALTIEIFSTIGGVMSIEESQFSIFTTLAGSSVAFAYLYMDTLARAAVKAGMPKQEALNIVAAATLGSALNVIQSDDSPWDLIDQVCSPKGMTIEGIASLQCHGFESTLTQAFDAVLQKDEKLR